MKVLPFNTTDVDYLTALYIRVSTEEQAEEGYSIEFQIEQGLIKAGVPKEILTDDFILLAIEKRSVPEYGIKIYIDDGHTGEVIERPELNLLLDDAKAGIIRRVVCYDPDRLSRKLMVQLMITDLLDRKKVEIYFVNGEYQNTIEGRLFYQMRGAIAEFDKEKINRQLSEGRRKKAKKGKVVKDYFIYGYDFNSETSKFVVNEEEAAIVKLIFDLCTKPFVMYEGEKIKVQGFNGIAIFLNERGIPTKKRKGIWHRQVVRQILKNRAYIGEFYQNKWNTEGMLLNKYRPKEERVQMKERPKDEWIQVPCPAIIEKETFDYVQKILEESRRRWAKESRRQYLLSGIVRCGECGNTMSGRKSRDWGTAVLVYSCAKNTAGAKNKGCGRRVKCQELDAEIWNTIHRWLNQPNEIASAVENNESDVRGTFEESEIKRIEKEIEKAKNARKRLLKLFASNDEILDDEDVRQELREWKEKENRLTKQMNELLQQLERSKQHQFSAHILEEAVNYYLSLNPQELSFEDQRELIRMVVKEVRSYKDHVEIYTF